MNADATTPHGGEPWWRFPLLWMVMAGPAAVVLASFATLWLALRTPDPVVGPESRRQGDVVGEDGTGKKLLPALTGRNHAATPPADLRSSGR